MDVLNLTVKVVGTGGSAEAIDGVLAAPASVKRAARHWRNRRGRQSSLLPPNSLLVEGAAAPLVPVEASITSQPVYKRRCSLTMPYPSLYGSWQASPAVSNGPRRWSAYQTDAEMDQNQQDQHIFTIVEVSNDCHRQQQQQEEEEKMENDDIDDDDDDGEHMDLIACTFQRLPLKDFGDEVRPALDVAQFIEQSVLLIDVSENSPIELADLLLNKMAPQFAEEAKMILFTHDTGYYY